MKNYLLEYTRPRVFRIGGLTLLPGINQVAADEWDRAASHPFMKQHFENGDLKWVPSNGPDSVKKDAPSPIAGLKIKDAVAIVKRTTKLSDLSGWLAIEKRKEVSAAISGQIAEIKKVEKDGDEQRELDKIKAGDK